jgi:hypothetical protein
MRMKDSRRVTRAKMRVREGSGGGKLASWVTCSSAQASLLTPGAPTPGTASHLLLLLFLFILLPGG